MNALEQKRHHDVLQNAHRRQQIEELENDPQRVAPISGEILFRGLMQRRFANKNLAAGRLVQPAKQMHQGAFATAALASDRDEFPSFDPSGNVIERMNPIRRARVFQIINFRHFLKANHPGKIVAMRHPGEPIFINRDFRVVAEHSDWIVVDKPPHLLVHPTVPNGPFTLWDGLREMLAFELANGGQISIINRLDRETSGLVLIAKHAVAARQLAMTMQSGNVEKEYLAIVHGHPTWSEITVDAPILRKGTVEPSAIHLKQMVHPAGAAAKTRFKVESLFFHASSIPLTLIRAIPVTGRTHQIRVHAAHLGYPLLGDKIYGPDENCYLEFIASGWTDTLAARLLHPRHALHSAVLRLPDLGLSWTSPLPDDLEKVIGVRTCSHR